MKTNCMGMLPFSERAGRDEVATRKVECRCGAVAEIEERWFGYTSRFVRVGPKMYLLLPNRWFVQSDPSKNLKDAETMCPYCMFDKTYEIFNSLRTSIKGLQLVMEKHGENEDPFG